MACFPVTIGFDDPITFTMNTAHTAFRVNTTGKELFQSIDKEFDKYQKFNMPTNDFFFKNSAVTSHSEATTEESLS